MRNFAQMFHLATQQNKMIYLALEDLNKTYFIKSRLGNINLNKSSPFIIQNPIESPKTFLTKVPINSSQAKVLLYSEKQYNNNSFQNNYSASIPTLLNKTQDSGNESSLSFSRLQKFDLSLRSLSRSDLDQKNINHISKILWERTHSPNIFEKQGNIINRRILGDYIDFEKWLLDDKTIVPPEYKKVIENTLQALNESKERSASLGKVTKYTNLTNIMQEFDSTLK